MQELLLLALRLVLLVLSAACPPRDPTLLVMCSELRPRKLALSRQAQVLHKFLDRLRVRVTSTLLEVSGIKPTRIISQPKTHIKLSKQD